MKTRFNWAQLWPKVSASAAMMQDPSGAILTQLRELRATLAGHTERLNRVAEHVDQIDGQLRDIHLLIARALERGVAGDPRLSDRGDPESSAAGPICKGRTDGGPEARPEDRPQGRLEERVTVIERRLARVEERLDGEATSRAGPIAPPTRPDVAPAPPPRQLSP